MSKRPDHIHCIADNQNSPLGTASNCMWCGRWVIGFRFADIDHAAMNGRNDGRLVACQACVRKIVKALQNGATETPITNRM